MANRIEFIWETGDKGEMLEGLMHLTGSFVDAHINQICYRGDKAIFVSDQALTKEEMIAFLDTLCGPVPTEEEPKILFLNCDPPGITLSDLLDMLKEWDGKSVYIYQRQYVDDPFICISKTPLTNAEIEAEIDKDADDDPKVEGQ